MTSTIYGEQPFKALKECFMVSATSSGDTLEYSTDKTTWTAWSEATPAGENTIVNGAVPYTWYRLKGNQSSNATVIIL